MKKNKTKRYAAPNAIPVTVQLEGGLLVNSAIAGGGDISGEPIDWDEEIVLDGGDGTNGGGSTYFE